MPLNVWISRFNEHHFDQCRVGIFLLLIFKLKRQLGVCTNTQTEREVDQPPRIKQLILTSLGIINSISIVSRFRKAFYTSIVIMLIIVFQSHKHCVKFIDMHLIIRIYVQFLEHSSGADHLLTGASCCFQVQEDNIRQVTVKYSITVQPRTLR